jgi:hypothetical protein
VLIPQQCLASCPSQQGLPCEQPTNTFYATFILLDVPPMVQAAEKQLLRPKNNSIKQTKQLVPYVPRSELITFVYHLLQTSQRLPYLIYGRLWPSSCTKKELINASLWHMWKAYAHHLSDWLAGFTVPFLSNLMLRLLNRSLEYCLDAFLQSVPLRIMAANSS